MITHFSEVEFSTPSCVGVVQVYHELLGLPLVYQDDDRVTLDLCSHTQIHFVRKQQPHSPFHIAFTVSASDYAAAKKFVESKLPTCGEMNPYRKYRHYFRDGDGNILELNAEQQFKSGSIIPHSPLGVMFLKEVGFVLHYFPGFYDWCKVVLDMESGYEREGPFAIMESGFANVVMTHEDRDWIPIAMRPLPPDMIVTMGTTDISMLQRLEAEHGFQTDPKTANAVSTVFQGYQIRVRHTPEFDRGLFEKTGLNDKDQLS